LTAAREDTVRLIHAPPKTARSVNPVASKKSSALWVRMKSALTDRTI
jgi:hypothetical protein